MRLLVPLLLLFLTLGCPAEAASTAKAAPPVRSPLVWDPMNAHHDVKPGEVGARFTFTVTNTSAADAEILEVNSSCDCTVAEMPSHPWIIKAHGTAKLEAVMDLRDKVASAASPSVYYKDIEVVGVGYTNDLKLTVAVPAMTNTLSNDEMTRRWGQALSSVDHQAVFKNDCVKCHLVPAYGKQGEYLFHTICGICHEAKNRASVVPDLSKLKTAIDASYWSNWVTYGKVGTLMPGFASTEGGALDDEQIRGLVAYLTTAFPRPMKTEATNSAK